MKFLALLLFVSVAHADPFDAFVGTYQTVQAPTVRAQNSPTCNKYDFTELSGFEVRADRTGFRQTHTLRLVVPNGYSVVRVVPWYKDPSELDPTVGQFGTSDGDDQKATTSQGTFGFDKNESVTLTIERDGARYKLAIANEMKSAAGDVLNACYYTAELTK